jgi:hypothetical protein
VGFIYIEKEKVRKEYSIKQIKKKNLEEVLEMLRNEVAIYDDYITGNVYGYNIQKDGEDCEDSCWGFFGDWDKSGLLDEAKSAVDWEIKNKLKKHIEKLKIWIKNKVGFEHREAHHV